MKIGIEVEMPGLSPAALDLLKLKGFKKYMVHDDGSCRGNTGVIDDLPVHTRATNISGWRRSSTIGLELVTHPLSIDEAQDFAQMFKRCYQHLDKHPDAGIHIHLDVTGKPWKYVQNLLLWFYKLEAPLYRLACAGTVHRGARKAGMDYGFCRPLSNPIGIHVTSKVVVSPDRRVDSVVHIHNIAAATTASELAAAWGRCDLCWSDGKYYTARRLMGLNFYSVLKRGTVEFRIFDAIYKYLPQFLEIVVGFEQLGNVTPGITENVFLLGSQEDAGMTYFEDVFNTRFGRLWGRKWQPGCREQYKLSHYREEFIDLDAETARITNNGGEEDDGSPKFPLYV